VALTEVGVQLVHYIEGLMAPRFGAMGSSALFLQMVEGPLPECTADDRAGIVHHHVADAAAGLGELVVVPIHVVDKLRAFVLGMGLSKLHSDGGLSCFARTARPEEPPL
jgi:hypothetical protein